MSGAQWITSATTEMKSLDAFLSQLDFLYNDDL